jgi:hypothetical protein
MMAFFGEVIKMCANVSYLMMTLKRYLLVGKDHAKWLVTLAKLEFKWVIRASFIFSVLVNVGHGWQYQAVEDLNLVGLGFNTTYEKISGYSYSDYPQANQGIPYLVYSIVYFFANFAAFFILNTGIEVKIVRRMHKELKEKRERLAKMNAAKSSTVAASLSETNNEDKKKEAEDEKKERRVITMVILNGVLNFVLRAPDMLFWMENKMTWSIFNFQFFDSADDYDYNLAVGQLPPGIFSLIPDIGYFTFILTFSTNFCIFYKFNKNFNEAVVFRASKKSKK